jgi:hypothetical protein
MTNGPEIAITLTLTAFIAMTIGFKYGPEPSITYLAGVIVGLVLPYFLTRAQQNKVMNWKK